MLDRLNIKALIQDAMLEYAYIADDVKKSDEVQTLTKPRLETLKKLEAEIGLHYDEKAWKFVSDKPAGTDDKQPEDDDDDSDKNDNVPDDEHEVAVVRNFVTAYRRARHCYFQKVFALQPGDDMNPKDALECVKKFRLCQNLYFKIPKAILEEVRTKFTAGQIYNEIGDFLECLQMFVDEYMSNEM